MHGVMPHDDVRKRRDEYERVSHNFTVFAFDDITLYYKV